MLFNLKQNDIHALKSYERHGYNHSYLERYFYDPIAQKISKYFLNKVNPHVILGSAFAIDAISFLLPFLFVSEPNIILQSLISLLNGLITILYQIAQKSSKKMFQELETNNAYLNFIMVASNSIITTVEVMKFFQSLGFGVTSVNIYIIVAVGFDIFTNSWAEYCKKSYLYHSISFVDEGIAIFALIQIINCFIPKFYTKIKAGKLIYLMIGLFSLNIVDNLISVIITADFANDYSLIVVSVFPGIFVILTALTCDFVTYSAFLDPYFFVCVGLEFGYLCEYMFIISMLNRPAKDLYNLGSVLHYILLVLPSLGILRNNPEYWFYCFWTIIIDIVMFDYRMYKNITMVMHDEANESLLDNKQENSDNPEPNINEFNNMETISLVEHTKPGKEPVPLFPPMIQ